MIFYVGSLRWELVTEIDFNDGGCKNFIRNFKLLCSTKQSVTMSRAVVTIHTVSAGLKTRNFFFFHLICCTYMFPAIIRVSLVLPYTQLELCNKNQLDALFILSLFRQSTVTCFGNICSPSSGGILYIYNTYQLSAVRGFDSRWCHWNFSVT